MEFLKLCTQVRTLSLLPRMLVSTAVVVDVSDAPLHKKYNDLKKKV